MDNAKTRSYGSDVPLECQREAFSLPPDVRYLNGAFMSPLPKVVEAAGMEGLLRKRNPTLIEPVHFFDQSDQVRERFAALVNVPDPTSVAIIPSGPETADSVADR